VNPYSSFFGKFEKDTSNCSKCKAVLKELEQKRKEGKSFAMNIVFSDGEFHLLPFYRCVSCGKKIEEPSEGDLGFGGSGGSSLKYKLKKLKWGTKIKSKLGI
jgi:predicted nucleic acid-binding Zn ribbon protein